jgi:predicted amidohydrolase YtcJ
MASPITIFRARHVRTLDPARPLTEAVAVSDGIVIATGSIDELSGYGDTVFDDTFADQVLLPGFVEAHSHILEGGLWAYEYVGWFDRVGPDGATRRGISSVAELIDRLSALSQAIEDPDETLIVWGFDPIYLDGPRLSARHLDGVTPNRPIFVFHASGHLATVNTELMTSEGFADGVEMEGVPLDPDGRPLGELQEPAAMSLARGALGSLFAGLISKESIGRLATLANRAGCTTVTELGLANLTDANTRAVWHEVLDDPNCPLRMSLFHNAGGDFRDAEDVADFMTDTSSFSTDKVHYGNVKIILDGSIQGFTARLNPPGYFGGQPNGIWLIAPERLDELMRALHQAQVTVHAHCNGDEAVDLFCDAVEAAQGAHSWADHRHTVQHCQMTTQAQYKRMAALGMSANIFSNHIYYWGDQHSDLILGPARAASMDACATAQRERVRFSVHSDAAITPLGQLHTMWCAVNRLTASGRVLGEHERISPESALRAVTIDAAHQLRLDHRIGSLEPGKCADMVALADDPIEVEPAAIREISVAGTVVSGRTFPV